MKKIFFMVVLANILLHSACQPYPYKNKVAYIVTNNTSDSVRLQFKTFSRVAPNSTFKKDTVYRIATILKGQSKTLYTRDSSQQNLFYKCISITYYSPERLDNGELNPYCQGRMYGVKGIGGDTIIANNKQFPSLSNTDYWTKETDTETATIIKRLILR